MKRFYAYFLMLCLIFTLLIQNANAVTTQDDNTTVMLRDVLKEANVNLLSDILDPEHFDDSMQSIDLEDEPMLLVYSINLHAYAEREIDEIISYAHNTYNVSIALLHDQPIVLNEYLQKTKIGVGPSYDPVPTYIQDVLDGSANQTFLGNAYNITNVICFDASTSHKGTTVLYETDGGTFVRFYQDQYAPAVEFTWETYQQHAIPYYEYTTSYEQNYDANGYAISGGVVSFLQFIENPSQYTVSPRPDSSWVIIVVGSAALLAATCAVVYFLIKSNNRRKQKN